MPVDDAEDAEEDESFGEPGLKSPTPSCSLCSSRVFGASGGSRERCVRAKDFCKSLISDTEDRWDKANSGA